MPVTYQSIRYKHHYGSVIVSATGQVNTSSLTGNTVSARLADGGEVRKPFGGFIEVTHIVNLQRVKLLGISALYEDELGVGPHYSIPKADYVVGVLVDDQFCVALYDGKPKHYPIDSSPKPKPENNVTRIY